MNLLLDTHAFVWFAQNDSRLSTAAREAIAAATNQVHVSAATSYEIALKSALKKLVFRPDAASVAQVVSGFAFVPLPITVDHAEHAGKLDLRHRDPFDRLIAAQALVENMRLVTADAAFKIFSVNIFW